MTRTPLQMAALLVGVVFLAVGVLGFIPGITTNYDQLGFVDENGAQLFGLFEVNALHNIVHLAFGVAGLAMAATLTGARAYLIGGGLVYAAVWIYGLVIDLQEQVNVLALNTADNWLHFGLSAAMLGLGLLLGRGVERAPDRRLEHRETAV